MPPTDDAGHGSAGAPGDPATGPDGIRIEGALDRRGAEALALEIRRLARRYGLEVRDLRILPDGVAAREPADPASPEAPS